MRTSFELEDSWSMFQDVLLRGDRKAFEHIQLQADDQDMSFSNEPRQVIAKTYMMWLYFTGASSLIEEDKSKAKKLNEELLPKLHKLYRGGIYDKDERQRPRLASLLEFCYIVKGKSYEAVAWYQKAADNLSAEARLPCTTGNETLSSVQNLGLVRREIILQHKMTEWMSQQGILYKTAEQYSSILAEEYDLVHVDELGAAVLSGDVKLDELVKVPFHSTKLMTALQELRSEDEVSDE